MNDYHYKAFITYSHDDSDEAARLQRALESYRVPPRLVGQSSGDGRIQRRIGRIFRDREELAAGATLSETLNAALAASEYLIVVCSPSARASRWVNLEIEQFRKTHRDENILCYVVDGEPLAGRDPDKEHLECFPAALGYLEKDSIDGIATEAVAADMREEGDGRHHARLKLISGLLGVGLDELVQRDSQRRHQKLMAVATGSVLGMIVMSTLTYIAVDARNGEQLRRAEAEDLIEFMLSDLRDRLEPVGRLDVLDAVGEKAIEYYSNMAISEHSAMSLGRRARAFHLLGEVDDLKGNLQGARDAFEQAFVSTAELLDRAPDDGQRIFNHAQSVFWIGYLDWRLGQNAAAESAFREYLALADRLVDIDPARSDWLAESGHANINLGVYYFESGQPRQAIDFFATGLGVFESLSDAEPDNTEWLEMRAQSLAWLADANENAGDLTTASRFRTVQSEIYAELLRADPNNQVTYESLAISHTALGDIALAQGELGASATTLEEGRRHANRLIALDPENTFYLYIAARLEISLAEVKLYQGSFAESAGVMRDASVKISSLMAQDSEVMEWIVVEQRLRLLEGQLMIADGDDEAALRHLTAVVDDLAELEGENPEVALLRQLLGVTRASLGRVHLSTGDVDRAMSHYEQVAHNLGPNESDLPLRFLSVLGLSYAATGQPDKASEITQRLSEAGYSHPESNLISAD